MKPLHLTAQNYGVFERLDLDVPLGACAIVGVNGSGKTTLVDALDRALFGSRSIGEWLSTGAVETEMTLCLEFESRDALYRVRRVYSARGRGKATLDLERARNPYPEHSGDDRGPEWEALTLESMKATQARIESIIGFDRAIFRASAYLTQGGAGSLTDPGMDARHRKALLCSLLGLDVYDSLLEAVRPRKRAAEDSIVGLMGRISGADVEVARLPELLEERVTLHTQIVSKSIDLKGAEEAREQAAAALAAAREGQARLDAARELLAARTKAYEDVKDRLAEIAGEQAQGRELGRERDAAAELAGKVDALSEELVEATNAANAQGRLDELRARLAKIEAESERLADVSMALGLKIQEFAGVAHARCDRCEQKLGHEARARALESAKAEYDEIGEQQKRVWTARDDLAPSIAEAQSAVRVTARPSQAINAELTAAQAARATVAALTARLTARLERMGELTVEREKKTAELPALTAAVAQTQADVNAAVDELVNFTDWNGEHAAETARAVEQTRSALEQLRLTEARVSTEIDRLTELEDQVADARRDLATEQRTLDVLTDAARMFGRNGLPAFILENRAIPLLEAKANEALGKLGGKTAGAWLELRTQREKKDGDGLVDALDIVVVSADGFERRLENWSGGEQMRVDVALRLALVALSGAEMGVLILDEPGNLDESGKGDLIELLGSVLELGVERVLLVSHDPELRESFDSTIEVVVGEDGRSRVEGVPEREAVPA